MFPTIVLLDDWGNQVDWLSGESRYFADPIGDGVKIRLVYVPAGKFQIGSFAAEGLGPEKPQHSVEIRAFFLSAFQVPPEQWQVVSQSPKVDIERQAEPVHRLPREAEWESACRAGIGTPFSFGGNILSRYVNFDGTQPYGNCVRTDFPEHPVRVGNLGIPNGFGLHDMPGSDREWRQDQWHPTSRFAPADGTVRDWGGESAVRVLRGGDYRSTADQCRSASRIRMPELTRQTGIDFRVARSM